MAQLKDLIVNGASRLIGDAFVNKIQITSISAPTSAGGSTYDTGTSGQVLKSNGTSIYWAADNNAGGTVTSITLKAGNGISLDTDNTAITTSGIRTISHADTSSQASVTANGRKYITGVTLDAYGHVTGLTTGTETVTDTHHTAYLRAGASGGTANAATITGNTYLNLVENGANRSGVKLVPGSNMAITSDASGNVTFTATNTTYSAGTGLSLSGTTFNAHNVPEAELTWGGKNFSASYGPIDAAMIQPLGANRFAFLNAAGLTIEYSTDGGSNWTDYGATDVQKTGLFGVGQSFMLGKHSATGTNTVNDQLRVTIATSTARIYTVLNKIAIYMSTSGNTVEVKIEKALESTPTTFSTHLDWTEISGWSGWNILNISDIRTYGNSAASQYGRIRFIFRQTVVNTNYPSANISRIMGFGGVGWTVPSNMARDGHLYSYDNAQNATFPAQITATAFNGNATSATTATNATNIYSSASTTKAYVLGTTTASSANHATVYNASVYTSGSVLFGAAWNDYAEYRITKDKIEAGRCVVETGHDDLILSSERLQPGAEIVSDTFGFAIGETEDAKTPIATTGRALAYIFEGRAAAQAAIGRPVCSGPNGTVSIMTDEEYQKYGYCAIGTISAVPDYEEWGEDNIKVNGRVWIRIR